MKKESQNGNEVQMPITRMHYSMLTQLFRNPLIFKLKYILNVYDGKVGMGGMIGRAGHEVLRTYYGGNADKPAMGDRDEMRAIAMEVGDQYLAEFSDFYVDYGKTGSREQLLKGFAQAMRFYWAEEPEYNEILYCEEKFESIIKTVDGQELPLPAVAKPDLVHKRKDGGIEIIDTKFVKSFTDWETEDYIKIVQSQFLWHVVKGATGINADRILFREIKITENSGPNAGKPQIRDYAIPFSHEQYRTIFYNLYRDAVRFIANPDVIYLPNLSDPFDGEQSGLLYAQGLLNADMSDVEVMHKVKDVAFTSKKFVPSRLERIENQYLPPQEKIKLRMAEFGIPIEPVETKEGATVTQYRFKVSAGVRMSVFEKHRADIQRAIEAKTDIRILAPIPGTDLVGVEVAAAVRTASNLTNDHLTQDTMMIPIGMTVHGEVTKVSLTDMPHILIAGATGSGKSVLLHSFITALTKQMRPDKMQLILIDPKRVELVAFRNVKHLHGGKIAYEYGDALLILKGLKDEMERRYKLLEKEKCRDIKEYNKKQNSVIRDLPYIVLVIDEFADLMLQGKAIERKKKSKQSMKNIVKRVQVEKMARQFAKMGMGFEPQFDEEDDATADEMIVRLAAMARAVGIHLIIATQRPSIDVITGLIKANFPTRIALTTASATDSKVILGVPGAEKLAGKGDMLFMHPGGGVIRLQGFLVK